MATAVSTALANAYLIGAPKCGTTSLARWLSAHPQVYFSVPKEPFYWADDYPRMGAHYGFSDRRSYAALFASAEARRAVIRAEGSTIYLYSRTAVPRICATVPDARFVVALRNPVELVVSYHRNQLVALNESERDLATAWRRSLAGGVPDTDPLDPKLLDYPRVGALGAALSRVLDIVPRERLHLLSLDDLRLDPASVWQALTAFLGVSAVPAPDFTAYNVSMKRARYPTVRRLTHRPPELLEKPFARFRQWTQTTSMPGVQAVKRRMWQPVTRPEPSPETRAVLADHFAPDTRLLASLVPLDVSGWLR